MITLSFSKAMVEGLHKELTRALGLNNLRLYKIVQGLLWVHEGKSLTSVAQLLRVDVKTVYNWLCRFLVKGLGWLGGQHYQGRARPQEQAQRRPEASALCDGQQGA